MGRVTSLQALETQPVVMVMVSVLKAVEVMVVGTFFQSIYGRGVVRRVVEDKRDAFWS